jgi:hypothetical protein
VVLFLPWVWMTLLVPIPFWAIGTSLALVPLPR